MPSSPNQKMKPLFLMRVLLERTDENHALTIQEILSALSEYNIKAERKSIYTDLELLRQYGMDIEMVQTKTFGYYMASRQFELPELKLLVDAVQSSRFITRKKSEVLIKKLASLTSTHQAKQLRRQVFVADRPKAINESVYYTIDAIHAAINDGLKIKFKYFDYNFSKTRVYRRDGERYTHTPLALCWNNDNYYLICYSTKHDDFTHCRVDRMSDVSVCDEKADKIDHRRLSVPEHIKQVFGMYGGAVVEATLRFDSSLINTVLDRFGGDIGLCKTGERFEIHVEVAESPVFLSWIAQFGDKAEIIAPDSLRGAMGRLIKELSAIYIQN